MSGPFANYDMDHLPSKQEECRACIGFDEKHTCEGWEQFQMMKAEKDKCPNCARLTAELFTMRNIFHEQDTRIAELEAALEDAMICLAEHDPEVEAIAKEVLVGLAQALANSEAET